jgi:hypothetical protein
MKRELFLAFEKRKNGERKSCSRAVERYSERFVYVVSF